MILDPSYRHLSEFDLSTVSHQPVTHCKNCWQVLCRCSQKNDGEANLLSSASWLSADYVTYVYSAAQVVAWH